MELTLQSRLRAWRQHNFPTSDGPTKIPGAIHLLGVAEEAGELAKAHIKQEQGIRGTPEEWEKKAQDSVGDIVIYLMQYCSDRGWNFQDLVTIVATEVLTRDWIKFPFNGVSQ
jgi:NTP pyrophosphatase (non-canonical NTP hydrolase)